MTTSKPLDLTSTPLAPSNQLDADAEYVISEFKSAEEFKMLGPTGSASLHLARAWLERKRE